MATPHPPQRHAHNEAGHDHAHEASAQDHADHGHAGHAHAGHDHGGHEHAGHSHGIGHVHAPANFGRAFALGITLNGLFVVAEVVAGFYGHSVALLADAGHNVSDILSLVLAWLASWLGTRPPSARFTYGLRGSSILAAFCNAVCLLLVVGALSLEAVQRLFDPQPVAGLTVMIVAGGGVLVNGITAWLFASGRHGDINIKGAYMHMMADALVSVGVVVGGGIILLTGWLWLDPVVSLGINLVIVLGTWSLLRDSFAMSMQAVPPGIEPQAVRDYLLGCGGVVRIHDLHIWPMSTTESAMTAHIVIPAGHPGDAFLHGTAEVLRDRFGIGHMTLQIETNEDGACLLAPEHVV